MSCHAGPDIVENGLVFCYDMNNTQKSWKGKPTTNLIYTTPLNLGTYAYVTGPTQISNILDSSFLVRTVNRYTISQVVNTARAAIYPSIAVGNSYAFSFKWKYNGTNTSTPSIAVSAAKGNPEASGGNTFSNEVTTTTSLKNGWNFTKYEFTVSTSATNACILTYGISTGSDNTYLNNTFDIYEEQFELSQYATPFVNGTRSNTQSILDLTNNNTITANNLTYNSDGAFSFDGTDEYIDSGLDISWNNTNSVSFTFVLKPASLTGFAGFAGKIYPDWEWAFYQSGADLSMVYWNTGGGHTNDMDWTASNFFTSITDYVIFQYVWDGSSSFVYKNGVLVLSKQAANPSINQNRSNNMLIGGHIYVWGDYYWNGSICFINVYNRALSAAEVAQNFNATRRIYGI